MAEHRVRLVGLTKEQVNGLEFGPKTTVTVSGQLTSVEKRPDFVLAESESESKNPPLVWEIGLEFDPKSVKISQGDKNVFEKMADDEEEG